MSVKDVLKVVEDHLKQKELVKEVVEKELMRVREDHNRVNREIQNNNSLKNKAEEVVKHCIANLHAKGISKEAFPALDAARAELDKVSKDEETEKLIKESEGLQHQVSALEDSLEKVSK